MKKLLTTVIAACVLVFALCALAGCGSTAGAGSAVSTALDAIKAADSEKLSSVYDGSVTPLDRNDINSILGYDSVTADNINALSDEQKKYVDTCLEKARDFDYKIVSENVEGDMATVEVEFTTYPFGTLFETDCGDMVTTALRASYNGKKASAADDAALKKFAQDCKALNAKGTTQTATITAMKSNDGNWKIGEISKEAYDAMLGGLITTADRLRTDVTIEVTSKAK